MKRGGGAEWAFEVRFWALRDELSLMADVFTP
jgi:hypothetical protein